MMLWGFKRVCDHYMRCSEHHSSNKGATSLSQFLLILKYHFYYYKVSCEKTKETNY